MNDSLARLAALHGIGLEYHDIWGNLHAATETTVRALLAAMGVPAQTDAEVDAALVTNGAVRWRQCIAPVVVVRVDARPWTLRLHLPAAQDEAMLGWRIVAEGGGLHSGAFTQAALAAPARATVDGEVFVAHGLSLSVDLPPGYHRLAILDAGEVIGETLFVVAATACYRPPALDNGGRIWGAAAQLYALRSARNWGIGDFTDLRTLVEQWTSQGAGIVGVNPLHALFPHEPSRASPYSPSSRLFVNALYLDVEAIPEFRECEEARALVHGAEFQATLKRLRDAELVDYAGVAEAKSRVLALLHAHFRDRHLAADGARAGAFRAFCADRGDALEKHALFEALQEHFVRMDPSIWGWPAWPEAFRDPRSPAVTRFAAGHADRIEYYRYLQWQADAQLAAIGRRSFELGVGVGLYQDLAVSIDRGGAEAWANQDVYALAASVGAPPDDYNLRGQNWGLPAWVPKRLHAAGYAPFIATLRANMRHAGALRIDHAMGLMRLFWVPPGSEPSDGAYVHYRFADLVGILALESQRHRCLVIGEDLGTVPDEVRAALSEIGVLSSRMLFFEREASGDFKPPAAYLPQAIVAASSHDLPTLAGWWEGRDLALRGELGLFPTEAAREAQVVGRAQDRARLLLALEHHHLLPPGTSTDPASLPAMTAGLARALQLYLAATPAQVLVIQLEDVIGVRDQANLPGTTEGHPNWRRKLPLPLEQWPDDERFGALARALRRSRQGAPAARRPRERAATARIPRATYRLQFYRDFTFDDAIAIVPYLAALGVSHVYCSPYLRARPGSHHGYDIVDHASLNPEIGNADDFERFVAALHRHGMGQIFDIVPNHMGVMGADNAWWQDVLENGPASTYAEYFDIDWHPIDPDLIGKLLVPVLGDHYGNVLERGELKLAFDSETGAFAVHYDSHRLPIDPREYPRILDHVLEAAGAVLPAGAAAELDSLVAALSHLPSRGDTAPEKIAERLRDKELLKGRLARLARENAPLAGAIERAARRFDGVPGERASFEALHELLEAQAYRIAYWRVASDEINYRRFFDVNDLAALRMENDAVFEATHRFVLDLAAEGKIDGLRIDHPDGLYDPARYLQRLQQRYALLTTGSEAPSADGRPLYVVVEKIDAPHEELPETWPVHGTTGYRFANLLNGLFVDSSAKARINRTWRAFVGDEARDFEEVAYQGKRTIMRSALAADLTVLANRLFRIARADRRTRDLTLNTLRLAIAEVAACFPVYRTYVADGVSAQDRRHIGCAVSRAKRRSRAADVSIFDFLQDVLLLAAPDDAPPLRKADYRAFAMRFQQFTAPVAAKGVEDTSFYVFNRLVSLNEVGGDPDRFGISTESFHRANLERAKRWPHTMLASSTHDNKRSEDVRARIDVISEMPAVWRLLVRRWSFMNRAHKRTVEGEPAPSPNDEYLLYQTLIGTYPAAGARGEELRAYRTRIEHYAVKAAREAKVHTSWISADKEYETALAAFVAALLDEAKSNEFLTDLSAQCPVFAWFGTLNSVAMALLKLTAPGVPDIYQGNELLDLSLVDPDNRRPVDYALRRSLLEALQALAAGRADSLAVRVHSLFDTPDDARAKLWATSRALALRRERADLFARGDYVPIAVEGQRARHAVAFARRHDGAGVIVATGRLFASMGLGPGVPPLGADAWGDTALELPFVAPAAPVTNVLTGETIELADGKLALARLFAHFPGALLVYDA